MADNPVHITPDCMKEWLTNGKILCYRVTSFADDNVEPWADDLAFEAEIWPIAIYFLCLIDVQYATGIPSPFAMQRSAQLTEVRSQGPCRIAVIVPNQEIVELIKPIATLVETTPQRHFSSFTEEADALAWLLQDA